VAATPWRGLGILVTIAGAIAAAAAIVTLTESAVTRVRAFELPNCRSGQTYDAQLDVCKPSGQISLEDFTYVYYRRLPAHSSPETIDQAVADFQKGSPVDRLWSHLLDWNRRRRQQVARQNTAAESAGVPEKQ
jgi:hypothetical protein